MAKSPYASLATFDRRVAGMLADPECVGELLLVGLGLARSFDLGDPPLEDGSMPTRVIAQQIYGAFWQPPQLLIGGRPGARGDAHPLKRMSDVFRADVRRYQPDDHNQWMYLTCGRPMIRREGVCGRNATGSPGRVVDPLDGSRTLVGACSNRPCRTWLDGVVARNRATLVEHPPPVPPANIGGVLERHLSEIDWWAVWRHVSPRWVPPPESVPYHRPTLTLHLNDLTPGEAATVTTKRPALTVLEGGWR